MDISKLVLPYDANSLIEIEEHKGNGYTLWSPRSVEIGSICRDSTDGLWVFTPYVVQPHHKVMIEAVVKSCNDGVAYG
jgi:hypothetical protein